MLVGSISTVSMFNFRITFVIKTVFFFFFGEQSFCFVMGQCQNKKGRL
jgi:hypothetical protein